MKKILFNLTMLLKQNPDYEQLSLEELHAIYNEKYEKVIKQDLKQVLDFIIFGTIQDVFDFNEDFEMLTKYDNENM